MMVVYMADLACSICDLDNTKKGYYYALQRPAVWQIAQSWDKEILVFRA